MSSTKVVILILVVVAVLFAGCIVFGVVTNPAENSSTSDENAVNKKEASNFNPSDHSVLGAMNSVLSPFATKVAASSLSPSATTYNLTASSSYSIKIQPAAGQSFRRLDVTTKPSKSCAALKFTLNNPPSFASDQPQTPTSNSANSVSFLVTSGGGELQINRTSSLNSRCVVTLQAGD